MKHLIGLFITVYFLMNVVVVSAFSNIVTLQTGEPIHLSYWFVTSGTSAPLGVDTLRGVEIAIEVFGGQVKGHPIKLSGQDEMCSPEGGKAAASRIASDPTIIAAIGSNCSSAAISGVPLLWKMGIPTVSPSNVTPFLTDPTSGPNYDGYLRTSLNDTVQGTIGAEFAYNKLGVRRAATVHDGLFYSNHLQQVFADAFTKLGGTITAQEAVSPGDTDMSRVLNKIEVSKPELLYFPMFTPESSYLTRQTKKIPGLENIALMSTDAAFSPDFLKWTGKAAIDMYFSNPDVPTLTDTYTAFLTKFKSKYGEDPEASFHAHAYDATMMILRAIEKVSMVSGNTLTIDRNKLNEALHATKGMKGLTGTITCNEHGDCADSKVAIFKILKTNFQTKKIPTNPFWKKQ